MKKPRTARAEIERLRTELEESVRLHFAAHQRMERAEAERDALRADAKRYRWLRDGPACIVDMVSDPDNLVQLWYVASPGVEQTAVGATLDAAIDAALHAALDALVAKETT